MFEQLMPGLAHAPNIHPLFVHFPIALWPAAALFWAIGLARRSDALFRFGLWLATLGTLGGIAALTTGFLAADAMGHDSPGHDMVHVHRDLMVATTALAALVTVAAFLLRRSAGRLRRAALLAGLCLTLVVMSIGADRGAEMVFRYGIGSRGEAPPASAAHHHGGHDHGAHDHGAHDHGAHDHGAHDHGSH